MWHDTFMIQGILVIHGFIIHGFTIHGFLEGFIPCISRYTPCNSRIFPTLKIQNFDPKVGFSFRITHFLTTKSPYHQTFDWYFSSFSREYSNFYKDLYRQCKMHKFDVPNMIVCQKNAQKVDFGKGVSPILWFLVLNHSS